MTIQISADAPVRHNRESAYDVLYLGKELPRFPNHGSLATPTTVLPVRQKKDWRQSLTPSERAFLRSIYWQRFDVDGKLTCRAFEPFGASVERAVKIAFEANARFGLASFEPTKARMLFGLYTQDRLMVSPSGAQADWPSASLETALNRDGRVSDIVYSWLAAKTTDPKRQGTRLVSDMMVRRGILEVEVFKQPVFWLFTVEKRQYTLADWALREMDRPDPAPEIGQRAAVSIAVGDSLSQEISSGFNRREASGD